MTQRLGTPGPRCGSCVGICSVWVQKMLKCLKLSLRSWFPHCHCFSCFSSVTSTSFCEILTSDVYAGLDSGFNSKFRRTSWAADGKTSVVFRWRRCCAGAGHTLFSILPVLETELKILYLLRRAKPSTPELQPSATFFLRARSFKGT